MNNIVFSIYVLGMLTSAYVGLKSIKNRFLPIAVPVALFSGLLIVAFALQLVGAYKLEQYYQQLFIDISIFLPLIGSPLLLWMLTEYYMGEKLTNKWFLLVLVVPGFMLCLFITNLISHASYIDTDTGQLYDQVNRLAPLWGVNRAYRLIFGVGLLLWAAYVIRVKTRNSVKELLLITGTLAIPMLLMYLYTSGVIPYKLGAPFWSLLLLWGARQYRLLDTMPIALPQIVKTINTGLIVLNTQSQLVYINQFARQWLGFTIREKHLVKHPVKASETLLECFDLSLKESQFASISTSPDAPLDKERFADVKLEPLENDKGQFFGWSIVFNDVTERRQNELILQDYTQKLQDSDLQKSQFFAGISHEFRTPLTLSLGMLKDISQGLHGPVPELLQQPLKISLENNERLLILVSQLLDLSQLEAQAMPLNVQRIELEQHLPLLLSAFESAASKQGVSIYFNCEISGTTVYYDPSALEKIVFNLISNALKSIADTGQVLVVVTEADDAYLQIRVTDTGCGIPEGVQATVFEPFFYRQHNNGLWPQGTGIGLSLVKQLVELHHGTIAVESDVGEGSVFTVQLRKGKEHFTDDQVVEVHTAEAGDDNSNQITQSDFPKADETGETPADNLDSVFYKEATEKVVLVVEDNADMRRYIRFHFGAEFRLIEAVDGEEGLQLAQQVLPDLILCDVMMPKMDGVELCQRIKSNVVSSHIPVLLLTAKSNQSSKIEGLQFGADDYLVKPFDVQELLTRINNLIDVRKKLKAVYRQQSYADEFSDELLPEMETSFLTELKQYMLEQIAQQSLYTADLAKAVNMSERTLNRKLKALTGETPKQMLQTVRLEYSAKLLLNTDLSITEVSYSSGFADASYFARKFKGHFMTTPNQYKKNINLAE